MRHFIHLIQWTRIILIGLSILMPIHVQAANKIYQKNILVFGDSLSAAYGIPQSSGWVTLLQKRLTEEKFNYQVSNASVSGETTLGGLNRLDAQLKLVKPRIVMIELGANDGLRGLPINEMQKNLSSMIEKCQKSGAKVVLLGIKMPPNYGPQYTASFSNTYEKLSKKWGTAIVPFFLDKVAANPALLLEDGLHPNEQAQPILLNNIWPILKTQLIQ